MPATEAQIAANRRNALKSTGPRSPEGKARSRANALKHGLCCNELVPEDLARFRNRAADWFAALKPRNFYHSWLVDEIALISVRIDRCERMERRLRDRDSLRAMIAWDEDRARDAELVGAQLARQPSATRARLRAIPQGCDWLIGRWTLLAQAAQNGSWSPEQRAMAFDLLGTPADFRDGEPGGTDDRLGLARTEIQTLSEHRVLAEDLDDVDRSLVESDLFDAHSPELRKLRRYESNLHSRLRWCVAQIQYESPHQHPHPDIDPPQRVAPVEPEAEPAAGSSAPSSGPAPAPAEPPRATRPSWFELHPPFDLEPEECPPPGEPVNLPAILRSRRQRREEKVEARRQAKRRKLERMRA